LYSEWRKVSDDGVGEGGLDAERLHRIVKGDFRASYLFLEKKRNPKLHAFLKDQEKRGRPFTLAYEDGSTALFAIP